MIEEKRGFAISGWVALPILLTAGAGCITMVSSDSEVVGILGLVFLGFCLAGFFTLEPNQSKVLTLFGNYVGTVREPGFHFTNPLCFPAKNSGISLRIRNFQGDTIKVNDLRGNPIEISAVVVWKVENTAQAAFGVDHYEHFVELQMDSALRHIASLYPYDDEEKPSLRSSQDDFNQAMLEELSERFLNAGVQVLEVRLSHLAYAPEIANSMLRKQQAEAVIQARRKIVEGAVSMVDQALEELSSKGIVELDPERRAAMVQNLMIVLCSDRDAQPVVNAGTFYH